MARLTVKNQCCVDKSIIKAVIAHKDGSSILFEKDDISKRYQGCFVCGDLAMHNIIVDWLNSDDDTNLTIESLK